MNSKQEALSHAGKVVILPPRRILLYRNSLIIRVSVETVFTSVVRHLLFSFITGFSIARSQQARYPKTLRSLYLRQLRSRWPSLRRLTSGRCPQDRLPVRGSRSRQTYQRASSIVDGGTPSRLKSIIDTRLLVVMIITHFVQGINLSTLSFIREITKLQGPRKWKPSSCILIIVLAQENFPKCRSWPCILAINFN
jgi:hypothetical protein